MSRLYENNESDAAPLSEVGTDVFITFDWNQYDGKVITVDYNLLIMKVF